MNTKRDDRRRELLLAWFAREQRDLPWRATKDAYAIWISEAMLQQTRVETVIDYWRRFMARFSDVRVLAAAHEADVLAQWSGLGYYRRARALHAAAKVIVERYSGEFPRDADAVRELPGVGPYTAGAVLSIAFDQAEALVDGNVVRVFSRWFAHDADYGATTAWAWEIARELVGSESGAGDWNQALMELGATLCTPREPACARCPVSMMCEAFARGVQHELPRAKQRPASIDVELLTVLVENGARVLLEQRPARGRMAGMWQLPTIEVVRDGRTAAQLFAAELPDALEIDAGESLATLRHSITCHRIRVSVVRGRLRAAVRAPFAWVERADIAALACTGMARKTLRACPRENALDRPAN